MYSVYGQGVCLLGLPGAMGGIGTLLALLLIRFTPLSKIPYVRGGIGTLLALLLIPR